MKALRQHLAVVLLIGTGVLGAFALSAAASTLGPDGGINSIPTNGKLCFDGPACTKYLTWNGSFLVSNQPFNVQGLIQTGGGANIQSQGLFDTVTGVLETSTASTTLNLKGNSAATGTNVRTDTLTTLTTGNIHCWANNAVDQTCMNFGGKFTFPATDSSGTPGAATINKPSLQAAIAASASSVVITDNLVTTASVPQCVLQATDGTCTSIKSIVPASGSFTVNVNAACTGATKVGCVVFN